jgi:hypothetical protein
MASPHGRAREYGALTKHAANSEQCLRDLASLRARGVSLPHDYARYASEGGWWYRVADANDGLLTGFVVEEARSRSLPGARLLRINKVGRGLHAPIAPHFGAICRRVVVDFPRVLRCNVALFDECNTDRQIIARSLHDAGFESVPARSYTRTLKLELGRSPEALLASFSKSTRRNIRRATRRGLRVHRLIDRMYLERCHTLYLEAFRRTAHGAPPISMERLLTSSDGVLACLLGVVEPSPTPRAEDLLAFAWVRSHGDYATYDTAGSTRLRSARGETPGDLLMMGCVEWAVERGHRWFDLGGVTNSHDGLAGISDFKRGFTRNEIDVGEEWELRPNAMLASLSELTRGVGAVARRFLR